MAEEICIKKKLPTKGDDGREIASVSMKAEFLAQLEELSAKTNRSRKKLINILLEASLDIVKVEE